MKYKNTEVITAEAAVANMRAYFDAASWDAHGRYMSWRHCYNAFSDCWEKTDNEAVDHLALHLAFYLASWGMYRGSSFLLQKDYKVHVPIVRLIQESQYQPLRGISAGALCRDEALGLLMELSERIRRCYRDETTAKGKEENHASDTLVTKILLGTLGCVPAYDTYFVNTIKRYGIADGKYGRKSVRSLAEFYCKNEECFESARRDFCACGTEYPPMKLIDMCFWQDGTQKTFQEKDAL